MVGLRIAHLKPFSGMVVVRDAQPTGLLFNATMLAGQPQGIAPTRQRYRYIKGINFKLSRLTWVAPFSYCLLRAGKVK